MAIKNKGFTLLEILVVITIIAIMSSVIILNIAAPTYSKFKSDVNKIAITFDLLVENAIFTNSVIVCKLDNNLLNCKSYKNDDWNDIDFSKIVSWNWPKNFIIKKVYINDSELQDNQKIYFMPSGFQTPVSFLITDGNYQIWVDGDINGKFTLSN